MPVAVAGATGLAAFDPNSGFYAIGAVAGLTHKLGRNWGLQGYAGYDRLIGDAADSPIVRAFGSRDQFSGGARPVLRIQRRRRPLTALGTVTGDCPW